MAQDVNEVLETVEAVAEVFTAHTGDKNNPHKVTKAQVELENVDNTADMDKPVSNAVADAIEAAVRILEDSIANAENLIATLRTDMTAGLADKAASNHTHSGYAASNHTHSGYAASSHNHDSVYSKTNHTHALNNSSITGILPDTKGGTGRNSLMGIHNSYGICSDKTKYPFYTDTTMTTAEWCRIFQREYLPKTIKYSQSYGGFCAGIWFEGLADLPEKIFGTLYASVNATSNTIFIYGKGAYTNTLYTFDLTKNVSSREGWITYKGITNTDGRGIFLVELGSTATDINSIRNPGIYKCTNWTNYPSGASNNGQGFLCNWLWGGTNTSGQGYQEYITAIGQIWYRWQNNGAYSAWQLIQSYGNYHRPVLAVASEQIKESKAGTDIKIWVGTQAEYNALASKDANTLYFCS